MVWISLLCLLQRYLFFLFCCGQELGFLSFLLFALLALTQWLHLSQIQNKGWVIITGPCSLSSHFIQCVVLSTVDTKVIIEAVTFCESHSCFMWFTNVSWFVAIRVAFPNVMVLFCANKTLWTYEYTVPAIICSMSPSLNSQFISSSYVNIQKSYCVVCIQSLETNPSNGSGLFVEHLFFVLHFLKLNELIWNFG